MPVPLTILMDNGSLEPAATLGLRRLAAALAKRIGQPVEAVSLLHSSGVPAEKIEGRAAEILEPSLDRRCAVGQHEFTIVPLFFGPSGALTEYVPQRLAHLRRRHPALKAVVAAPLFDPADDRLARILADHVREVSPAPGRVALVDHGSPARAVTDVRNELAAQLQAALGTEWRVAPASMERREGSDYDFAEPLLGRWLRRSGWNEGRVAIAMQFLLPGRHAGPEGDVAAICREAEAASNGRLQTVMTRLVAEHPLLVEILEDRWRAAAAARP